MDNHNGMERIRYIPEMTDNNMPINIIDVMRHLLGKWRIIVLISIIGASIGGIAGMIKYKSTAVETNVTSDIVTPPDLEKLTARAASKLSDEQKAEADEIYSKFLAYQAAIDKQEEQINNSYIMSLNPNSSVGYYMQYLVETNLANADSAYKNNLFSENDYKRASEIFGTDAEQRTLDEAVTIGVKVPETASSSEFDLERSNRLVGDVDNRYMVIIIANIICSDMETCEKIVDIVDEAIARRTDILSKKDVVGNCSLINQGFNQYVEKSITSSQLDKTNDLAELVKKEVDFNKNLFSAADAAEKTYIDRLRGIYPEEKEEKTVNVQEANNSPKNPLFFCVIGLFVGFVASAGFIALKYITDGRLHSKQELLERFRLPVLQDLSKDKVDEGNALVRLKEELDDKLRKENIVKLYVAVDSSSGRAVDLGRRIIADTPGELVFTVGGIIPNTEEMKELLESESILIVPAIDGTKNECITSFLDLCKRNYKYIVGAVPVRDWKTK